MAQDAELVLTREGYDRLKDELEHLRTVRRHEVTERLKAAREGGDPEGSEYALARDEQAFVEGRIAALEELMSEAEVVEPSASGKHPVVAIGRTVVVRGEDGVKERYSIVGHMEADPAEGRISSESPVGQALMGHRVGDVVEVKTPMGLLRLTIAKII